MDINYHKKYILKKNFIEPYFLKYEIELKTDTILKLKKYNLNFLIPDTYVFKTDEWKISKKEIINIIQKKIQKKNCYKIFFV